MPVLSAVRGRPAGRQQQARNYGGTLPVSPHARFGRARRDAGPIQRWLLRRANARPRNPTAKIASVIGFTTNDAATSTRAGTKASLSIVFTPMIPAVPRFERQSHPDSRERPGSCQRARTSRDTNSGEYDAVRDLAGEMEVEEENRQMEEFKGLHGEPRTPPRSSVGVGGSED